MIYNAFEILGLSSSASLDEVEARYRELRDKYQRDRFLPGEEGENAAEKLQQLEVAYRDIQSTFTERVSEDDENYSDVQKLIEEGKLDEAQDRLDKRNNRDAEWHYMQSILFYKRSWFLESKKQLEFALQLEPGNQRYKDSLEKLTKILASNTISPDQMRTTSRPVDNGPTVGAGNGTCTGNACADCLLCNMCCNCMSCMNGC